MHDEDLLAREFETHRAHLRSVAYRMLGSLAEADDAVQEAWLRYSRTLVALLDPDVVLRNDAGPTAVADGRIVAIDALSDPERLVAIDLTVLDDPGA